MFVRVVQEQVDPGDVDKALRLPAAARKEGVHAPVSRTFTGLGKEAYVVRMRESIVPKPIRGIYSTCEPSAHTKQVGFERLISKLQPRRDDRGVPYFENIDLVPVRVKW